MFEIASETSGELAYRGAMHTLSKSKSIGLLIIAEMAGMILWFTTAAILPDMVRETPISEARQAWLSSGVQAGFVVGALFIAVTGIADRFDPRRIFFLSALCAAAANLGLLIAPLGGDVAIGLRVLTGVMLAGVYPIGMKIAFGWGSKDRGFLVGLLVGGLTLGKSLPYLLAFAGGAEWRLAIVATSIIAMLGGVMVLFCGLGPGHVRSVQFDLKAIGLAWTNRKIRGAYLGYLGHMWELFAFWAWIAAAASASYAASLGQHEAESLGKLTAFLAIGLGAPACVVAGIWADRIGKAEVTLMALVLSGSAAILTALSFGGPVWITMVLIVFWGISVIPDSAQFSAIVADHAPAHLSGSLLTLQTALGFTLTIATVQITPIAAAAFGWPIVLASLALGPVAGIIAMLPLRRSRQADQ